jgi:hypothetical protein
MADVQQQKTTTKDRIKFLTAHSLQCFQGMKKLVVMFVQKFGNFQVDDTFDTEANIRVAESIYNDVREQKDKLVVDLKVALVDLGFILGEDNMLPGESVDFQEDESEEVKDEEYLSRALVPIGQNLREWEEEFFSHFLEKLQGLLDSRTMEGYVQFALDVVNGSFQGQETTILRAGICLGKLESDLIGLNWRYQTLDMDSKEEENSDGQDPNKEESQADEAGEDEDK